MESKQQQPTTAIGVNKFFSGGYMPFECFNDESYYDMWAVREIGNKTWGDCMHVASKKEADHAVEWLDNMEEKFTYTNSRIAEIACNIEAVTDTLHGVVSGTYIDMLREYIEQLRKC